jgi:hypothetical protein
MKKIFQVILLALLSLQAYAEDAPDWQSPNASDYENFTVMMVKIEDALKPNATSGDLMAVFVGDELRGVAKPASIVGSESNDASNYVLKVFGNEADGTLLDITLKYYNAQLQKIFTYSCTITFSSDEPIGITEDFIPPFTSGDELEQAMATLVGALAEAEAFYDSIKDERPELTEGLLFAINQAKKVLDDPEATLDDIQFAINLLNVILQQDKDLVTGITVVNADAGVAGKCYDLQGRHVAKPTKGVYIVNGKKVVIK